jgi:hypothetical protein
MMNSDESQSCWVQRLAATLAFVVEMDADQAQNRIGAHTQRTDRPDLISALSLNTVAR